MLTNNTPTETFAGVAPSLGRERDRYRLLLSCWIPSIWVRTQTGISQTKTLWRCRLCH